MKGYCFDPSSDPYFHKLFYQCLEQNGLSDEDFFTALSETPAYLATPLFQAKIKEWQSILQTDLSSEYSQAFAEACTGKATHITERDREQAKDNLKRIGEVLAHEGQGRPRISDTVRNKIEREYREIYMIIYKKEEGKEKDKYYSLVEWIDNRENPATKLLDIKEHFPALKDDAEEVLKDTAGKPQKLAFNILAKEHNVSHYTVKKIVIPFQAEIIKAIKSIKKSKADT